MKEKIKKYIKEILFTAMYLFRQAIYYINVVNGYFLVGNLDFFYLYAPACAIKYRKNKKIKLKILAALSVLLTYVFIQYILIQDFNLARALINMLKILICYMIFIYANEQIKSYNINSIIKTFICCITILLVLALIFNNGILWRHNDQINKYSLQRLKLLYTEPSELGFHCILMCIFIIGRMLSNKLNKVFASIALGILGIILFLAKPMGAIAIGGIAILALILYDWINNKTKFKNIFYPIMAIICIGILFIMIYTKSSLYLRIMDTLKGNDSSNNYRIHVAFEVTGEMLKDTYGLGVGLGNAELTKNVEKYHKIGLESDGIINSYMNIIGEGGILGIAMVGTIIYKLLKKSFKDKDAVKLALSLFIIVYQLCGSHFTNPICWIIYGIILSDRKFIEDKK